METPRTREKVQREHAGTAPLFDLVFNVHPSVCIVFPLFLSAACMCSVYMLLCAHHCPHLNEAFILDEGGMHTHQSVLEYIFTPTKHVTSLSYPDQILLFTHKHAYSAYPSCSYTHTYAHKHTRTCAQSMITFPNHIPTPPTSPHKHIYAPF